MCTAPSLLSTAIVATLLSAPVVTDGLTDTLKKIKDTSIITLGHRDASIPLSYLGAEPGKPIGYSYNLQLKVVEAVRKKFNLLDLKVRYNLVTLQTRTPLVQNGTVDIECNSTASNEGRQEQAGFSAGIFGVSARLLSKKTANIKDLDNLKGKSVVTAADTTSERLLKAMNTDKRMGMNIISAKDHGESFMILESSHAVTFVTDDALLYGGMAKAKKPDDWVIGGIPQPFKICGCVVRRDDTTLKKAVDRTITNTYASSEVNKIYGKWFTQPIPPEDLNLNFPISEGLKKLIASPTDKAAEQM